MEKVVLYVGLTDEENKALSSEEIESTLTKRATALMDYAEALNYEVVGIYRDGYYIGNSENRINFNNMLSSLVNKSVNIVLSTYDEIISNVKEKFNEFISKLNEKKIEFKSIYKLNPEEIIVIYDDIDTNPGKIRIRKKGGPGTHNGMKSVVSRLNSEDFPRVRVGIGMPEFKGDLVNYVIGNITDEDYEELKKGINKASEAVASIIKDGIDMAMNKYNK